MEILLWIEDQLKLGSINDVLTLLVESGFGIMGATFEDFIQYNYKRENHENIKNMWRFEQRYDWMDGLAQKVL